MHRVLSAYLSSFTISYTCFMFQIKKLQEQLNNLQKELSGFLRADRLDALKYQSKTSRKCSDETIQVALQIRCACGIGG